MAWGQRVSELTVVMPVQHYMGGVYASPFPLQMLMQYLYYGGTESMEIPTADILQVRAGHVAQCPPGLHLSAPISDPYGSSTWGMIPVSCVRILLQTGQVLGTPPSPAFLACLWGSA